MSITESFNIELHETRHGIGAIDAPKVKHFYIAHKDDGETYYGLRSSGGKRLGLKLDRSQAKDLAKTLLIFAEEGVV
jgi:hypothetical protein|tara:strand:- start:245 stop:475 length:231 start_codon:yes stop_codon:yes gene_type:complete